MSPSSTGDSPRSATTAATVGRFSLPTQGSFSIDLQGAPLSSASNGSVNTIKSPATIKQRAASFSREGILGAAQKARNLSQTSDTRPDIMSGSNQAKTPSDEGSINPLKRRNPDSSVDYPRRRATIAVRYRIPPLEVRRMLTTVVVRGLPVPQITMRRHEAKV